MELIFVTLRTNPEVLVAPGVQAFRQRATYLAPTLPAKFNAGDLPDFLDETKEVRTSDWKVRDIPADLLDRRVEITGPVDRKMIINALNADVKVFMADFEDSLSPTWDNVANGQKNLYDAIRRTITFENPSNGKKYALNDETATLMCRVRGLHLKEKGISYEEINISHSDNPALVLEKIRSYTDMRTFPQIILDGKHIGGYTDLVAYYAEENSNI